MWQSDYCTLWKLLLIYGSFRILFYEQETNEIIEGAAMVYISSYAKWNQFEKE